MTTKTNKNLSFNYLPTLGQKHGTDKYSHGFLEYYESIFHNLKNEKINLLEIGVFFGSSIEMWKNYFEKGNIYGIDTFEGNQGNGMVFQNAEYYYNQWETNKPERIFLKKCNQSSELDLQNFVKYCKQNDIRFDIIIDDGSHLMRDQQITLGYLYELLNDGGFYIVEDIHSCDSNKEYDVNLDYSNTTKKVLLDLQNTHKLNSPYISDENQIKSIESSYEWIEHFVSANTVSQTITIKKK